MSAFTGFLVKKTIQEYPIRAQLSYYQDYQRQNLTLYINKKMADMRLSSGNNTINAKSLVNINIQTAADIPTKIKKNRQIKSTSMTRPKTQGSMKKHHKIPPKPEQKVASLLNDELLRQNSTSSLFQEYKMANLKANLQKLQAQKKCNLLELNHVELNDDEQINYYLSELCRQHPEIDVGKMLDVDVEKVTNVAKENKLNEIIEKRINQEELDQIISQDEKAKLVRVYKESRYDQFEPEYSKKNKLKMTTFKKQKEVQEKLFEQIFDDQVANTRIDPAKFLRTPTVNNKIKRRLSNAKPLSHRQSPMVSQFESRPQTAMMAAHTQSQTFLTAKKSQDRIDPETQFQMQEIIGYCVDLEAEQKREKKNIKRKINKLEKDIQRSVRTVSEQFNNEEKQSSQIDLGFQKFQSETLFKRKLIGFLVNQVADKTEILSQKVRKETTKNFIKKVSKQEQ